MIVNSPLPNSNASETLSIRPESRTREVVSALARQTLSVARVQEKPVLKSRPAKPDPDALHDYRVALRRLRSLLSALKEVYPEEVVAGWKAELGEIARKTGLVRDLDVYLLAHEQMAVSLPEALREDLAPYFKSLARERRRAFRQLTDFLQSPGYEATMKRLDAELALAAELPETGASHSPVAQQAAERMAQRLKRFSRDIAALTPDSPDDEIHEIRILGKKLRYLLDFFGLFFPGKAAKATSKQLAKLQKKLGRFNDTTVQQGIAIRYAQKQSKRLPSAQALAIGGLIGVQYSAHQRQRKEACKSLRAFSSDPSLGRFHQQLEKAARLPYPCPTTVS